MSMTAYDAHVDTAGNADVTNGSSALRSVVRQMVEPSTGARRHLARGVALDDFFERLERQGARYVVLRWFETLPHVDEGEDIDLLVADEDLALVHSLMASRAGLRRTQKFDVYSVSGLPGSDFNGIPYFPPHFARALLDHSELWKGRYRVPSAQQHYESLAYHAVYHKGYASGLAGTSPEKAGRPSEHDYAAVLTALSARLGRPVEPTLDSLDRDLADRGLRPPLDMLERLEPTNQWITDRFFADRREIDEVWRGLAVFVLRERAKSQVDVSVQELDRQGFEVLEVVQLDSSQQDAVGHRLRGGNWAQGPWPLSGGGPTTYLIAYDVAPRLSGSHGSARAVNLRIAPAKEALRARLLAGVEPEGRYNPVHSSDNPGQALDYLDALGDPAVQPRVRTVAHELVDACAFPYPVVRHLSGQARRARVAVVRHPVHGDCICKVFRPGATRFFERELRAREELGHLPEVPELLESGERWLLSPLYVDDGSHVRRDREGQVAVQLTPRAVHALVRFAVALHERGLFLLDLSVPNIVSDPVAGLKIIDLEFLQEYAGAVPDLSDAYTFRGLPDGVTGYDVPLLEGRSRRRGPAGLAGCVNPVFHPAVTGSTVEALLQPHRALDSARRAVVQRTWHDLIVQRRRYLAARTSLRGSRVGRDVRALVRLTRGTLRA